MNARSISEVEFTFFDTETTGLSPRDGDRVIELAAIRVRGGAPVAEFSSLVNPRRLVSEGAFRVNGISDDMLADAPLMEDVLPDFLKFAEGSCFCSYNAPFDIGFLENELTLCGLESAAIRRATVVDVLKMARRLLPGLQRYALWFVADALGIRKEQEHRALSDVAMTLDVFLRLNNSLRDKGVTDYRHLVQLFASSGKHLEDAHTQTRAQLQEAIDTGAKLSITYFSFVDAKVTERQILPKELRQDKNAGYLAAYCFLRNEDRLFRIDGILRLEII